MRKIEKLKIKLHQRTEKEYVEAKAKFIAEYTEYKPGGFFRTGYDEHKPDIGEAKWNSFYPEGFFDWKAQGGDRLTSYGTQGIIDKINEIIDYLVDLKKRGEH